MRVGSRIELPDFPACAAVRNAAQDGRQTSGPFHLAGVIRDQVLPQLQENMRQSATRAMPVHGIVFQSAVIRLVVSDDKTILGSQPAQHGFARTRIQIPQNRCMPGPGHTAPAGREAVNRHDDRRRGNIDHRIERLIDESVIGLVNTFAAESAFGVVDTGVARHNSAVGQAHDECRIVFPPVRVDQQPGESRQTGRCAQVPGKFERNRAGTDIVADVALELLRCHAEISITRRNGVPGMVAQKQESGLQITGHIFGRPKNLTRYRCCLCHVLLRGNWLSAECGRRKQYVKPREEPSWNPEKPEDLPIPGRSPPNLTQTLENSVNSWPFPIAKPHLYTLY